MARHSFIRMSKLPNVKGRIDYISSPDRQENLYATYQTADAEFWKNLAFESQQEFRRFGTEGKCIEATKALLPWDFRTRKMVVSFFRSIDNNPPIRHAMPQPICAAHVQNFHGQGFL